MRQYSLAIYANELLLLTEVVETIEKDSPFADIKIYGGELAGTELKTAGEEYDILKPDQLGDEEVLIVLSGPGDDFDSLKDFDGDIIDLSGSFMGIVEDIFTIEEPIAFILKNLEEEPAEIDAVATVPAAVFGKKGIDDLITQTRELFVFSELKTSVFDQRLIFNMYFSDMDQGILSGYRQKLMIDTGINVDVRMAPLSTGFILDVYFKKGVNSTFTFTGSKGEFVPLLSDAVDRGGVTLVSSSSNRATFAGDYIKIIVSQIIKTIKEITGED